MKVLSRSTFIRATEENRTRGSGITKLFIHQIFLYLLCSGALRPPALVALCGISGSHYCQRQLLDWVGKQPISVSPSSWTIQLKTSNNNQRIWDTLALLLFTPENCCSGWFGLIAPRWRLLSALSNEQAWQYKIPCHYDECLCTARSVCCIKTAPLCQTNVYSKLRSLSSFPCKVTDTTNLPIT